MKKIYQFFDNTFLDLGRQFKWTYLPPLMVYVAAGISGLTGIVRTFFVKDYLNLSAAFLAGLGFWAGIPWALKMSLGHLVDLIWPLTQHDRSYNQKNFLNLNGLEQMNLKHAQIASTHFWMYYVQNMVKCVLHLGRHEQSSYL